MASLETPVAEPQPGASSSALLISLPLGFNQRAGFSKWVQEIMCTNDVFPALQDILYTQVTVWELLH